VSRSCPCSPVAVPPAPQNDNLGALNAIPDPQNAEPAPQNADNAAAKAQPLEVFRTFCLPPFLFASFLPSTVELYTDGPYNAFFSVEELIEPG
jgi:hypothetical protein